MDSLEDAILPNKNRSHDDFTGFVDNSTNDELGINGFMPIVDLEMHEENVNCLVAHDSSLDLSDCCGDTECDICFEDSSLFHNVS